MDNASSVNVAAGVSPPYQEPAPTPAPVRSQSSSLSSGRNIGLRRPTRKSTADSSRTGSKSSLASKRTDTLLAIADSKSARFICPICFDDTQVTTLALSCDHPFCTACWNAYVMSKIRDEAEHAIRCMAQGCALVAPGPIVKSILGDDIATWERYQELLVRHFVANNPNLKYCPYPSCTNTVSCPAAASRSSLTSVVPTVTCPAEGGTHRFCFGCTIDGDHRPVVCSVAKMWLKKCRDDSETANWIKSNTKECSQCQSTIEKNGGCKLVI
jgi:ariadne-1